MNWRVRRTLFCLVVVAAVAAVIWVARNTERCKPGDTGIKIGGSIVVAGCP